MAKLKPPPLLPQIRASLKFELSLSLSLSLSKISYYGYESPSLSAVGDQRRLNLNSRKFDGGGRSSSANWWTPLFGWSLEPNYIDFWNRSNKKRIELEKLEMEPDLARTRTRFMLGCFTGEKAKQLWMMTKETESFHDKMYHSTITSHNLATDSHNPVTDFHNPTIDSSIP